MRAAALLWRAIFVCNCDDWVAWRAYLRCTLAGCQLPHAQRGQDGRGMCASPGVASAVETDSTAQVNCGLLSVDSVVATQMDVL